MNRFVYTAEVAVSKIFPAGFGWQLSSCYAESIWGLGPNDLGESCGRDQTNLQPKSTREGAGRCSRGSTGAGVAIVAPSS